MTHEQSIQDHQSVRKAKHRPWYFGLLLFACIIAISLGSFGIWYSISRLPIYAVVYVNGVEVPGEDAYISRSTFDAERFFQHLKVEGSFKVKWSFARNFGFPDESAKIPLIAVWEAMGAEVTWLSDDQAEILFEGNHFILTLSEKTMYFTNSEKMDAELNALASVVGSNTASWDPIENDLLIDESVFRFVFWVQDKPIEISWDKRNKQITIVRTE